MEQLQQTALQSQQLSDPLDEGVDIGPHSEDVQKLAETRKARSSRGRRKKKTSQEAVPSSKDASKDYHPKDPSSSLQPTRP